MDNIYKNIEESNTNKERKRLIIFDDIYPDTLSNKKRNPIVTELFIGGRKLNIFLVFITQSIARKNMFSFFQMFWKDCLSKKFAMEYIFLVLSCISQKYYLIF